MARDPRTLQGEAGKVLAAELNAAGFEGAEEIGRGGFGVVYRCTQVGLNRVVAVKVLTADLEAHRPRFVREQQAMARLTGHPNIVAVLQVGETLSGYPYLVMPYLRRGCIHERIRDSGLLPVAEVLLMGVKMAGALESAHRLGVLHRDVKPANIMLTDYGEPALTDFGIAHITGGFKTDSGIFTGTPAFIAPEVLSGSPPSPASDTYGLGATLFCALTGHAAFERRSGEEVMAQFLRIAAGPMPDLREEGIPEDVTAIVEQAMRRNPRERPSVATLGEALQQLQAKRGLQVDQMALHGMEVTDRLAERPIVHTQVRARAAGLPAPLTSLVGRHDEFVQLRNLLSSSRLVTLSGMGGVGKTTLATHAARELSSMGFPDGVWLVELAELHDDALLPEVAAAALGIRDQSSRPLTDVLIEFLHPREALVVLDNCEHLIESAAQFAEALLRHCPQMRILATSREVLGIDGESVMSLSPLPCPNIDADPTLTGLTNYDAVALFVERARAAVPGFALTTRNAGAVWRICSQLDGLPLALELAAARLRAMSVREIADGLSDRYALLNQGRRGAPRRQQTLAFCVRWSYELCSPAEQQLWARLSVFAGSFDLPAAQHVCGEDLGIDQLVDQVSSLVAKSILIRIEHDDAVRFRMLESLRDYGKARISEVHDDPWLERRHADWYRQLLEQAAAQWISPHQVDWIHRLTVEMPNIREALQFSLLDAPATALQMTAALRPMWVTGAMLAEARHWLDVALTATPPEPSLDRIRAVCGAATIADFQSDRPAARMLIDEVRAHLDAIADPVAVGLVKAVDGYNAMIRGDTHHARDCIQDAAAATDDLEVQLVSKFLSAWLHTASGEFDQALSWFDETLRFAESHGESVWRAKTLTGFGLASFLRGDTQRAEQLLHQGLQLSEMTDDLLNGAQCMETLGWVAAFNDDARRAVVLMAAASAVSHAVGAQLIGFAHLDPVHDEWESRARKQLDVASFDQAWSLGSSLSFGQAIDFALPHASGEAATLIETLDAATHQGSGSDHLA